MRYSQNGLRSADAEDTLSLMKEVLLTTSLEVRFERRWIPCAPFPYVLLHFTPNDGQPDELYLGKGLNDNQCMASAFMELIERLCARIIDRGIMIEASYREVKDYTRDPEKFVLPLNTPYSPDTRIDWVWGYSLTQEERVMVPANLVFYPYTADKPGKWIAGTDSNGLASGNCIEEAILHGIMEVIERDARLIMEYNYMTMPDVEVDHLNSETISHLLKNLEEAKIDVWIKDITNDIPVLSIGVFLRGLHENAETMSYAVGTYIHPEIALSRALTEALQLYPRSFNYQQWLDSGPIDHLYAESTRKTRLSAFANQSSIDLKENINWCVQMLKGFDAEVIVVDLSRPELIFSAVRVCITNLQPIMYSQNPRISKRLYDVPVTMGCRERALGLDDIKFRQILGYRQGIAV